MLLPLQGDILTSLYPGCYPGLGASALSGRIGKIQSIRLKTLCDTLLCHALFVIAFFTTKTPFFGNYLTYLYYFTYF